MILALSLWQTDTYDGGRAVNRGPEEADAETVRVGVLLDELDFPGAPRLCQV